MSKTQSWPQRGLEFSSEACFLDHQRLSLDFLSPRVCRVPPVNRALFQVLSSQQPAPQTEPRAPHLPLPWDGMGRPSCPGAQRADVSEAGERPGWWGCLPSCGALRNPLTDKGALEQGPEGLQRTTWLSGKRGSRERGRHMRRPCCRPRGARGEVCPEGRGGGGRRGRRSVERHAGRACLTSASEARFWFVVAVVTIWLG